MKINVPISLGELLDKISILEIKNEKIKDEKKLNNVSKELTSLKKTLELLNLNSKDLKPLYDKLKEINLKLWNIEDDIRILEKEGKFEEKFIQLARNVYITNDQRFEIKNQINISFNSDFVEEKSYEEYL